MKKLIQPLLCLSAFALITACASAPKGAQEIRLKSPTGVSYTAYHSVTKTKEYEGDQMVKEKTEGVDFIVEKKPVTKNASDKTAPVEMLLTTVAKNGTLDLHEYGFPELKESIEFAYTPSGEVLKAGNFNRQSLFFVPPLPLPKGPVEAGDTWELSHDWASASGLELTLNVVGIHKGFKSCGAQGPCADIEISGSVKPRADRVAGMQMTSQLSGDLIYSLKEGDVLSSKVKSHEELQFPKRRVESVSCMVSVPAKSADLKGISFPACELQK